MLNDIEKEFFKTNLSGYTHKKLCDIIVSSRYLGIMEQEAIFCMEELAKRRTEGDLFDFETYIENTQKQLPNIKIDLKNKMQIGFDLSKLKDLR